VQTIALIDYGSGNLRSAERALLAAAANANRRREVRVTSDPSYVRLADRIVLPGQGAFGRCIAGLASVPGLIGALEEAVTRRGAPFLGICVGMQLLAETGLEHGAHRGLGWLGGVCRPLEAGGERLPHMGWSPVAACAVHPVLTPGGAAAHYYFAHSYILEPSDPAAVAGASRHGERFAAAVAKGPILGVQFHPEKSQAAGLALLARFVDWTP
jgi:glutamine amidotransferase